MYSDVVLGIEHHLFEDALEIAKEDNGFYSDVEMGAQQWQTLVAQYKAIVQEALGRPFPQDVTEQLRRNEAREAIGRRKAEDEYERFLRQLRDEAYIETRLAS